MHFSKVSKPNPCEITLEAENKLPSHDITSIILNVSTKFFTQRSESRNKKIWIQKRRNVMTSYEILQYEKWQ